MGYNNLFNLIFCQTDIELFKNSDDDYYSLIIGIPSNIDICVSRLMHSLRQSCSSIDSCMGLPKYNNNNLI